MLDFKIAEPKGSIEEKRDISPKKSPIQKKATIIAEKKPMDVKTYAK